MNAINQTDDVSVLPDRRLLELAAHAADVRLSPMEIKNVDGAGDHRFIGYLADPTEWPRGWFDPLKDDGDALRLASRLPGRAFFSLDTILAFATQYHEDSPEKMNYIRRQIVEGAARIAQRMGA